MSYFQSHNYFMKNYNLSLSEKLHLFDKRYFALIISLVVIGLMMLYSVAGGHFSPWASKQLVRFIFCVFACIGVSLINLRFFLKYAYVAYAIGLVLLVAVSLFGTVGMGAQRWLNLGLFRLQPSEVMKIVLILALARYFHSATVEQIHSFKHMMIPVLMMLVPVGLILTQPDLGTAMMLVLGSCFIYFLVGVQIWKFVAVGMLGLCFLPIIWSFLHDYQRQRVLTFLNPESDPFGAGYHILQSKITLGSGGLLGKGFLQGTQSRLNFIPEKQTDFIFTVLCEEFGLCGSFLLLVIYAYIIGYGFVIANKCQNFFGKILAAGLTINFALYVFINMGMVMGLLPVVGVPLPLVSYGGTAMATLFVAFGIMENISINQKMQIGRRGSSDDI